MIIGDDDAGRVDDEPGAERVGLAALHLAALVAVLGGAATPVLEEVVEELLERRARRQLRHRFPVAAAALGLDILRGRDVDDGVDHLLGDFGDAVRSARTDRRCRQHAGGTERDGNPDHAQATGQGGSGTDHVILSPKGVEIASTVRLNGSEAQAFAPGISAKSWFPAAHDFVDATAICGGRLPSFRGAK